jgi:hypothetical protein
VKVAKQLKQHVETDPWPGAPCFFDHGFVINPHKASRAADKIGHTLFAGNVSWDNLAPRNLRHDSPQLICVATIGDVFAERGAPSPAGAITGLKRFLKLLRGSLIYHLRKECNMKMSTGAGA